MYHFMDKIIDQQLKKRIIYSSWINKLMMDQEIKLSRDSKSLLFGNISILNSLDLILADGKKEVSVNQYKEKVFSLLYEVYEGTEKERNILIKKIHEIHTVAEIYNFLFEALFKDTVMEIMIRREIQKQMRKKESIQNYYDKLWGLTSQAFDNVTIGNNCKSELYTIYKYIYNKGVDVFIKSE